MAIIDCLAIPSCVPRENPEHLDVILSKPTALDDIVHTGFEIFRLYTQAKPKDIKVIKNGIDIMYLIKMENFNKTLRLHCRHSVEDGKKAEGFRMSYEDGLFLYFAEDYLTKHTKQNQGGKQNEKNIEFNSGYVAGLKYSTSSAR